MPTVREATFELFRAHGMTTIFGNPGSTELPMLADFPDDFRYILGLQELAVVGMADGFSQASGRPTHVNLHTAPGVGNAVGGILNAQANKTPLVITAGQQVRPHITMEASLTNRDAVFGPQPYVKWSHGRSRGAWSRHPLRVAASSRSSVRVDPDGRLERAGRSGSRH
jgi:benzoylformate decarboxylase